MPSDDIQRIKNSEDIVSVAKRLGLKVYPDNKCHCPNPSGHRNGDKSPSLSLFPKTRTFKCWVCPDVRGDVVDLVRLTLACDLPAALEWFGAARSEPSRIIPQAKAGREVLLKRAGRAEISALEHFVELLSPPSECIRWFESRGIPANVVEASGIREIANYQATSENLIANHSMAVLQSSGLFNQAGKLRFYRHWIVMPYLDMAGRIAYIQARNPSPADGPKELNLGGTVPLPWGMPEASRSPRIAICEGIIDAMSMRAVGIQSVAIPGASAFKDAWIKFFRGKDILIALDNDQAGTRGDQAIRSALGSFAKSLVTLDLPDGCDVNDCLRMNPQALHWPAVPQCVETDSQQEA